MPSHDVSDSSGSGGTSEMSKDEIYDFLSSDDDKAEEIDISDKKVEKDAKKSDNREESAKRDRDRAEKPEVEEENEEDGEEEEEKEEDDDELKELEEELEEPDDEKLELVTPVRRKEILAKYPQIFKDFPYLEKAYYREQQFTEYFPTITDAKEAADKASTLDKVENDLNNGNIELLLKSVHGNKKAFGKLVDGYMEALSKTDKDAYLHVLGNTIKGTIYQMVSQAKKTNNSDLEVAAQLLNQFVFGSSDWSPPEKMSKDTDDKISERELELNRREQGLKEAKFKEVNEDLNTRINNSIKATIESHIDSKGSMSAFVKKHAVTDALGQVSELISKDNRFRSLVDKLWENAIRNNYSKDSVDKIRSAFHSKAKTVLPTVIKQARNEALRGMGKRVRDDSNSSDKSDKSDKSENRESKRGIKDDRDDEQPRSRNSSGKKQIPAEMSTLEYLMADD